MQQMLFHIFRNTPLGRETLLGSTYFCRRVGATPLVYVPQHIKFLMYFENDVVQVDLDGSYLSAPQTAQAHARQLLEDAGLKGQFFTPKNFTASSLPDIPTRFDYMCCPRSISDLSSKIGLGYIGPRVRRIVQAARFPVLITSPVFKPWKSLAVMFGGSSNAIKALRLALRIARDAQVPIDLFTQAESGGRKSYEKIIADAGLDAELNALMRQWHFFEQGTIEENVYNLDHDALLVLGAYGHGVIREIVFGSKMEKIQTVMPNPMVIVGPKYTATG